MKRDLITDDLEAAGDIPGEGRAGDLEPFPDDLKAFWTKNPDGVVHLISQR